MKVSELFLKARKDKNLKYFAVIDRIEKNQDQEMVRNTCIRLNVEVKGRYESKSYDTEMVETPTTIRYEDYSGKQLIKSNSNFSAVFMESVYGQSHIKTFLNAIKKDSEVSFRVVAYNGNDVWDEIGFVHHTLYGIVDEKPYILSYYVGKNNSASPIQA